MSLRQGCIYWIILFPHLVAISADAIYLGKKYEGKEKKEVNLKKEERRQIKGKIKFEV
jgi:hypothetical protein